MHSIRDLFLNNSKKINKQYNKQTNNKQIINKTYL